jgi:transcription elongation GreA/GreB family factor
MMVWTDAAEAGIDIDRNHISWVSPLGRALMKSAVTA